jgi:putative addiction module component (TIGR02574 family)
MTELKVACMSKAELLEEFTKLTPTERSELWDALWSLEAQNLLGIQAPSDEEKLLLDREMDDYQKNPQAGSTWSEVEARLRTKA